MHDINRDGAALDPRAVALLDAWFADSTHDVAALAKRMAWWFESDAVRDAQLQARFGDLAVAAAAGALDAWSATPRGRLALILALDQLPRNCFRGERTAFASDAAALAQMERGLQRGDDRALHPVERMFFYMPMQHAEDAAVQERAVECFARLAAEAPAGTRTVFENCLRFAQLHRDIVRRFGRFPHRNAILGRAGTPDEIAWLAADAPDFGQKRR